MLQFSNNFILQASSSPPPARAKISGGNWPNHKGLKSPVAVCSWTCACQICHSQCHVLVLNILSIALCNWNVWHIFPTVLILWHQLDRILRVKWKPGFQCTCNTWAFCLICWFFWHYMKLFTTLVPVILIKIDIINILFQGGRVFLKMLNASSVNPWTCNIIFDGTAWLPACIA